MSLSPPVPRSAVFKTAIPVSLANTSETVGLLVDAALLAPFGVAALAGTGVASSLLLFFQLMAMALGMGLQALVARDQADSARHAGTGVLLALILGATSLLLLSIGTPAALTLLGAHGEVNALASASMDVWRWGIFPFFLARAVRHIFIAHCRTTPVAAGSLLSIAVKVSVNLLLLRGASNPDEAVRALAMAAVLASLVELAFLAALLSARRSWLSLSGNWTFRARSARGIFRVGGTAALEFGMWQGGTLVLTRMLAGASPLHLALYHVGMRIQSLFMLASTGFSASNMSFTSEALGRGNFAALIPIRNSHLMAALLFSAIGALAALLFPGPILAFFFHGEGLPDAWLARAVIALCAVLVLVRTVNTVGGSAIRSLGHVPYFFATQAFSITVLIGVTGAVLRIPALSLSAPFLAMLLDESGRAAATLVYYKWAVGRLGRSPAKAPASAQAGEREFG